MASEGEGSWCSTTNSSTFLPRTGLHLKQVLDGPLERRGQGITNVKRVLLSDPAFLLCYSTEPGPKTTARGGATPCLILFHYKIGDFKSIFTVASLHGVDLKPLRTFFKVHSITAGQVCVRQLRDISLPPAT